MGIEDMTEASDAGIEKGADAVETKTGGKGTEQIEQGQQTVDTKIGE